MQGSKGFRSLKALFHKRRQGIGNGYFFEKPPKYPAHFGVPALPVEALVFIHLVQKIRRPHNWPGH